ncbi:MAG TPA: efflux transporter outer membrane subunit [Nitrospiria bacterium]|nr:efflux transporter outer membrane subunit [Nitrospiria bacterium]
MRPAQLAILAAAAAATLLTGCMVGPDFKRPQPPAVDRYTETLLPPETASSQGTGGASQRFVSDREIPAEWWTLFHSKPLDQLIRQALANSPTLAASQAALRQAQEDLRAEFGVVAFPEVNGSFSAEKQQFSSAAFGQPNAPHNTFNLYNASVNVSYSLDLFGGGRRGLEALRAQVDFQGFQLEAAHLALTANIVTASVQEASLREQIRATQELISELDKQVGIVERQFQLGGASRSDVLLQQTQLEQLRATLPPLELALAQTRHLLAALVGAFPVDAALPEFRLDTLELPQELPVSLPSAVVRQRPDVLASEALLHQASADIGVATAALFPQITLTGSVGSEAGQLSNLFSGPSAVWSLGAALLQPVFHGGELRAKRRAAFDAYDQAAAQYRETVLLAFQNVADVLRALDLDAERLKAQVKAEAAARDTLDMTQKQYDLGAVNFLALLAAQRQYRQAEVLMIQAQSQRYADTAALFQALGGGWWNRGGPIPPVAPVAVSAK